MDPLPIRIGDSGDAVRDLQQRLTGAGIELHAGDPRGSYGPSTAEAVRAFQASRRLPATGICDQTTWTALVEAGYRPGDRLLYLRSPMLRGEDVAELQRALGALGFDAGRVDGIFGPQTERAVLDFQHNVDLPADGKCGQAVLASLARLGRRAEHSTNVAGVRERERLRSRPPVLADLRVVLGEAGGLDVLVTAIDRVLVDAAALVAVTHHPHPSVQAVEANDFGADVYLGFGLSDRTSCEVAYYATTGFESAGGHRLAALVVEAWRDLGEFDVDDPCGRAITVLRETRMPAVVCQLGPPATVVEHTAELAQAVLRALSAWVEGAAEA
ncbi:MAG TPA: peptidoglycan-binding protein [Acidimicrobiales bacterium]|nr:peptidoglycan-binding protein [Acidimicrobiales bacterium]